MTDNATPQKLPSHQFVGFSAAIESYCHITIFSPQDNQQERVVVCCQPRNYSGTSVTNGIESIRDTLIEGGHVPKDMKRVTWFEYYPPGTGLRNSGSIAQIEFDDFNFPTWFPPAQFEDVAKRVNLSEAEFMDAVTYD